MGVFWDDDYHENGRGRTIRSSMRGVECRNTVPGFNLVLHYTKEADIGEHWSGNMAVPLMQEAVVPAKRETWTWK